MLDLAQIVSTNDTNRFSATENSKISLPKMVFITNYMQNEGKSKKVPVIVDKT